jgi:hypothetical protein
MSGSTTEIAGIWGLEPMREGEYPLCYRVGFDGVTRIQFDSYCPEPYCHRISYRVYKGDHLHSVVNDQAIAEVVYVEPKP